MHRFYSYFFEHESFKVTVTFQSDNGLSLDCVESLAQCGSLHRRQWAIIMMDSIPLGDTVVNLIDQKLFMQAPFHTFIQKEFGSEGLVSHTRDNDNITLRITQLVMFLFIYLPLYLYIVSPF